MEAQTKWGLYRAGTPIMKEAFFSSESEEDVRPRRVKREVQREPVS